MSSYFIHQRGNFNECDTIENRGEVVFILGFQPLTIVDEESTVMHISELLFVMARY